MPDRARERTEQVEDGALVALGQEGPCFHPAVRVGLGDVVDGNLTRNGHHVVARVGDRIYDAFTGPAGMTLADCMARLQARYGFDWSIVATPSRRPSGPGKLCAAAGCAEPHAA